MPQDVGVLYISLNMLRRLYSTVIVHMWIAFLVSVERLATAAQMPLTNCYSRVLGVIVAAECWLVYLFPVIMT